MKPTQSSQTTGTQTVTPGTSISALGSALLLVFFFIPWFTACSVEVSGMDLAMQQSPQGQSGVWLLGIPLVGLVGVILAFGALNKPLKVVGDRAKAMLIIAFYPLLCLGLLYWNLKGPQQQGLIDLRPIIQVEFGFWGSILAALAMLGGAVLDLAAARGQPVATLPASFSAAAAAKLPSMAADLAKQLTSSPTGPSPPPAKQARAWLEGQNGEWARQKIEIFSDTLTIGRHHDSDLHLPDKSVSRHHAVIRCGHGRYFIQDQESAVGTYVNGQRVDACELKPGDVICIGLAEFRFQTS